MTWRNGSTYQGFIKNDAKHGLGKFTDKQGNTYTGDFFDNEYHGQGILIFTKKDSRYPKKTILCRRILQRLLPRLR